MKTVDRWLDRLKDRLAPQGRKQFLIVVADAAQKLALDSDTCIQILREAGRTDSASPICCVDLGHTSSWPERGGVGEVPPGARRPP